MDCTHLGAFLKIYTAYETSYWFEIRPSMRREAALGPSQTAAGVELGPNVGLQPGYGLGQYRKLTVQSTT